MRHRAPARLVMAAVLAILWGCGDVERTSETVDTAAALSATLRDSAGRIADTATGTVESDRTAYPAEDSLVDSIAMPAFVSAADSVAGRAVYVGAGTCFTCHGMNARGIPPLGSDLTDRQWAHTDGSLGGIALVVGHGIPASSGQRGMPGLATRLTEEQIRQVSAYTYAISRPPADTSGSRGQ